MEIATLTAVLQTTGGPETKAAMDAVTSSASNVERVTNTLTVSLEKMSQELMRAAAGGPQETSSLDAMAKITVALERATNALSNAMDRNINKTNAAAQANERYVATGRKRLLGMNDAGQNMYAEEVIDTKPAAALKGIEAGAESAARSLRVGLRPALMASTDALVLMGASGSGVINGLGRSLVTLASGFNIWTVGITAAIAIFGALYSASQKQEEIDQKRSETTLKYAKTMKDLKDETEAIVLAQKAFEGQNIEIATALLKERRAASDIQDHLNQKFRNGDGGTVGGLDETIQRYKEIEKELRAGGDESGADKFAQRRKDLEEMYQGHVASLKLERDSSDELKNQTDAIKKKVTAEKEYADAVSHSRVQLASAGRSSSTSLYASETAEMARRLRQGPNYIETPGAAELRAAEERLKLINQQIGAHVAKPGGQRDDELDALKLELADEKELVEQIKIRKGILGEIAIISREAASRQREAAVVLAEENEFSAGDAKNRKDAVASLERYFAREEEISQAQARLNALRTGGDEAVIVLQDKIVEKQKLLNAMDNQGLGVVDGKREALAGELLTLTLMLPVQRQLTDEAKAQALSMQARQRLFSDMDRNASTAARLNPNATTTTLPQFERLEQIKAKTAEIAYLDANRTKDHDEIVAKLQSEIGALQEQEKVSEQLAYAEERRQAGNKFANSITSGVENAFVQLMKDKNWKTFTASLGQDIQDATFHALIAGFLKAAGLEKAGESTGQAIFSIFGQAANGASQANAGGAGSTTGAAADAGAAAGTVGAKSLTLEASFHMHPDEATADAVAANMSARGSNAVAMKGGGSPGVRHGTLKIRPRSG